MTAKTGAERVAETRAKREAQGLKRIEVYAHPDDIAAVKAYAAKLTAKRLKQRQR